MRRWKPAYSQRNWQKVANCICLFGLHHVDAFPIDTHVKQLLDKYYSDGFDLSATRVWRELSSSICFI